MLPRLLNAKVSLTHQMRSRAIYDVPVYEVVATLTGEFELPLASLPQDNLRLDEAELVLGIAQTHAIADMEPLQWGEQTLNFAASTGQSWLGGGVRVRVPVKSEGRMPFQVTEGGGEAAALVKSVFIDAEDFRTGS